MAFRLGHKNRLKIIRFTAHGAILDGGDGSEILMPKKYTCEEQHPGDEVDVFVYLDASGRPVGTTETPRAEVGQFAYLKVAWTNRYGAFMDWGLTKDLFVPFREQQHHFMKDKWYIVYIYIDDRTGRIVGTSKLDRNLSEEVSGLRRGDEVKLLVWKKTELGYKVIVNDRFEGLVYGNQIFKPISIGEQLTGYVSQIRPDGKLDISLQREGRPLIEDFTTQLLSALKEAEGFLPYGDHSAPDEIKNRFHVSKKTFKRALGALYKKHLISLTQEGIFFTPEE